MRFRKGSHKAEEYFGAQHRFEHWYRDNTVYFITARCRGAYPAFTSENAKSIFWNRFDHYTELYGFSPWVTSLLDNHYHTLGYLRTGTNLAPLMQRLHGSIAKLVNDLLPHRLLPFWVDKGHRNYFDGCIRDELQARRASRYTLTQCSRHLICQSPEDYPHTRAQIERESAIRRASELDAFLRKVPYKRYEQRPRDKRDSNAAHI